jgi:hypothetical protein
MEVFTFSPEDWLLSELTLFYVKVNMKTFPSESDELVHNTLDIILGIVAYLP